MATELLPHAPEAATQAVVLRAVNPLDMSPGEFRQALARRSENRKALIEWIRSSLVDGVDFGAVPLRRGGFSKPSLRKPGAEKICGMLGVTATFPTLKEYEAVALEGREISQVTLCCHLINQEDKIVADGVGSRSLGQDNGDLNKALKMALKSAQIDATLRMGGLSEIFTQDLEDMPQGTADQHEPAPAEQAQAHAKPPYQSAYRPSGNERRQASEKQVKLLQVKLDQAEITTREFCEKFEIESVADLPFGKVSDALKWISGSAT